MHEATATVQEERASGIVCANDREGSASASVTVTGPLGTESAMAWRSFGRIISSRNLSTDQAL